MADGKRLAWKRAQPALRQAPRYPEIGQQRRPIPTSTISSANHADTESVQPMIAYFRSYADAGEPVPDVALQGLMKAYDIVPSSPRHRADAGEELARRGNVAGARRARLPIAVGAYDSPEHARAKVVLAGLLPR